MFPLLRLADFCGAPRRVLAKTGALRQQRLRCIVRRTRSALLRNRDRAGTWRPALRRRALRASLSAPAAVGGTGKMFPLLRLADFCGAPRWVLAKTGARLRVAVAQICGAGHSPLAHLDGCPCSASPVSAAGSGSAAQPAAASCFVHWTRSPPLRVLPGGQAGAGHGRPDVFLQKIRKNSGVSLRIRTPARDSPPCMGVSGPGKRRKMRNRPRERRWCRWRARRNPRQPRPLGC